MLAMPSGAKTFVGILLIAVALVLAALLIEDPYYQAVLVLVPIWATFGLSWNLFSGYTGLISFGHATFFGLGAFTVVLMTTLLGVTPWLGIFAAAATGALASVIIGRITFRLRGHYFALAMLAYPSLFIFFFDWMGWQELSFPIDRASPIMAMHFDDTRIYSVLGVMMMTLAMLVTALTERSLFGLAMLSIKQNEFAAEAAGINTFRIKMVAFVASGALAGLCGAYYTIVLRIVTPNGVFAPLVSAQALIVSLFGGVGTLWGPLIGAAVLIPFTEWLRASLGHILPGIQGVIYGLTIVAVMLIAPEGVFWRVRDVFARHRPGERDTVADRQTPLFSSPMTARIEPLLLLDVSGLSKSFGGLRAVNGVGFQIEAGTIVGIIGPNGAGKTTLFNLLNGFQVPSAGKVAFMGKDLVGLKPNEVCRRGIGRTFQVARPFPRMSVLNNVLVGALASSDDRASATSHAWQALATVGLGSKGSALVGGLTNLELRLMELARALASRPKLVLLDETLAGLGAGEVEAILPVIKSLPSYGVTVLIIEHTMHAMTRLANTFIVLDHGEVIANGSPTAVMNETSVIEAYLGKRWTEAHAHA